ncbi:MAG: hypothetical protein CMJ36_01910 [Phycisphaerae bacterium]|nr:hypothetical protein [Phycisphaerae bacterium]
MSTRATFIMLLLAVLAAACAWMLGEPGEVRERELVRSSLVEGMEISPGEFEAIRVEYGTGDSVVFQREGETWWQVSPFRHRAQTVAMLALVESALQSEIVEELPETDAESLRRLDLMPPRGTITFVHGGGELVVELGRTGIGGRSYMRRNQSGPVLVTNGNLHEYVLEQDPVLWRDRMLFPGIDIEVDRIERVIGDSRIVIEREGSRWSMSDPIRTRLNQDEVGRHIIELARAGWSDVILEEPGDVTVFGLAPPVASIRVTHRGEEHVLHVGERLGGETEARSAMFDGVPVVLRLDSGTVSSILSDPSGLIDHTGTGVQPADVKRIVIESGDATLVIERTLDTWTAPGHDGQVVPSEPVERLLESLAELRATEIELRETYPADLERARVTLHGFGGQPLDTVRLLRETEDSGRWGMENGDGVIRIHPEFLVLPLEPGDYDLPEDTP